jgi:hypothetical protein
MEAREVSHISASVTCDFYEQAHESEACLPASLGLSEEWIKYMGTFTKQQRILYSNIYNPSWAKHSKFSHRSNNVLQPPQKNPPQGTHQQQPRVNLEEMITQGMKMTWIQL